MTLTLTDSQNITMNLATFRAMTVKELSKLLTDAKVEGRSTAKTKEEKVKLLMVKYLGYDVTNEPTELEIEGYTLPNRSDVETTSEVSQQPTDAEIEAIDTAADNALTKALKTLRHCDTAAEWAKLRQCDRQTVTVIRHKSSFTAPPHYFTYASDALRVERATEFVADHYPARSGDLAMMMFDPSAYDRLVAQLAEKGIALITC